MAEHEANKRKFAEAVETHIDALYGFALRLTRNEADADDLVAEAVTKGWTSIHTLEDQSHFRAWMFRILRNHHISECRKKQVRPLTISLEEYVEAPDEDDVVTLLNAQPSEFLQWWANPETAVANRLLGEQIKAAIDELPAPFREVIMLVNVDGLGYDEAARVLDVPTGTIRSRMKRGRTLLQKALWMHARDAGLIQGQE